MNKGVPQACLGFRSEIENAAGPYTSKANVTSHAEDVSTLERWSHRLDEADQCIPDALQRSKRARR